MIWEEPLSAIMPMVIGLLLAAGTVFAVDRYIESTRASVQYLIPPNDHDAPVTLTPITGGGYILSAHYFAGDPGQCIRAWNDKLCKDCMPQRPGVTPQYFDIGSGLAGIGFGGTTRGGYWVHRYIPPGLEPGEWKYFQRVYQQCGWMFLVPWQTTSAPYTVGIP